MANINTQTTNILDKKKITSTADTVGNIQKPTEKDRDLALEEPKSLEDIKQSLAPSEQAQRRERMSKEGPIPF